MTLKITSADVLAPRQFTIRPDQTGIDGEIRVDMHPDMGIFDLLDASGTRLGLLMGFPIDLQERCLVSGPVTLGSEVSTGIDAIAERILDRFGGRFLFLLEMSGHARIYPDCAAQLPCVYSPERGVAGSTADAVLSDEEYDALFRHDLYTALDVENDGWFPAGLTAHEGIERLLPNHFLDLHEWIQKRYWPLGNVERTQTPERSIEEISEIIRLQLEALVNGPRKVAQALTAGHETRMMLACARPFVDSIELVTLEGDGPRADDTVISQRITRGMGLKHRLLPRVIADEDTVARYMRRGGHCVGGPNRLTHASLAPLRDNHVFVGGAIGEVGRAFFWHESDGRGTALDGKILTSRMGAPARAELEDRLTGWLSELHDLDSLQALDLAYLEQRVGPWGGAQMFSDPTFVRHNPLGTARTIELMLALPDEWKRRSKLTTDLVRMLWPELLSYPFNSQGAVADLLKRAGRATRRPQLIVRKFRKMRR